MTASPLRESRCARRFVRQQDRLAAERAGHGYALLLAARKLRDDRTH
jgi:hypothetical protein